MIERICGFIHNFFTKPEDMYEGEYTIQGGRIELPFMLDGQYFRIMGSALNDGVYLYPAENLADETFTGEIWAMKVPKAVKDIAEEAKELDDKYAGVMNGPYQSETFNGYSYSKADTNGGGGDGWLFGDKGVFGARLSRWRKIA